MRRGQATTEYLIIVSFLVVALIVTVWSFVGPFEEGVDALGDDAENLFDQATQDGSGGRR